MTPADVSPESFNPVQRLADRAALLDLAAALNRRYGVDLAHLQQYGPGQYLLVRRGSTVVGTQSSGSTPR